MQSIVDLTFKATSSSSIDNFTMYGFDAWNKKDQLSVNKKQLHIQVYSV